MQNNTFEMKIGTTIFVISTDQVERAKGTAEEKLKKIMIKDLIAKDNAMVS